MKKYIITTLLLIFLIGNSYSQEKALLRKEKMDKLNNRLENNNKLSIGYFLTTKSEKVDIYRSQNSMETFLEIGSSSDYALTAERLFYHNDKGKIKKVKQARISQLFVGDHYYTRLKIGSTFGFNRLHQVIAENDNYILTEYFSHSSFYYYLFNKEAEKFVYKKERSSNNSKADRKFANKYLRPYFKTCSEFISQLNNNLDREYEQNFGQSSYISNMTLGISNLKCD